MSVANQDRYEEFIAVVNEGSGVIFQPMTDEYSYILTAKHTLYEDKEMKKPIQNHKLSVRNTDINFIKKYEHNNSDIAILKIIKVNIETPLKCFKDIEDKKYDFWGHPKYSRNHNDEESLDNFKLMANKTESNESIVVFDNPEFSEKQVIDGFSGGGIFTQENDLIYLVAIEFEMNALPTKRRDRRIKAVSIKAFDEIIGAYKNELEPLLSSQLLSFKGYEQDLLNLFPSSVKRLLENEMKSIYDKPITPLEITTKINEKLFYPFCDTYQNKTHYKELWEGWLFYLVLISIYLNKSFEKDDIINLDKQNIYHLFIEDEENNINKIISDIIRNDQYFKQESSIVFNTKHSTQNKSYCYYSRNIPKDITEAYSQSDEDKMYTDNAFQTKKLSFILLNNIKSKVAQIDNTTLDEIREIINRDIFCERSLLKKILNILKIG